MLTDRRNALLAGVSRELFNLALTCGYSVIGVSDPNKTGRWLGFEIFSDDGRAIRELRPDVVVNGIDAPQQRARLDAFFSGLGVEPASLIGGDVDPESTLGPGAIVQKGAVISCDCLLGRCAKVNVGATVMHDAVIGDYVTIAPRALLLGRVRIGARAFIGANAVVLPEVDVGEDAVVGAGAVVTRNVLAGEVVVGVPAAPLAIRSENV